MTQALFNEMENEIYLHRDPQKNKADFGRALLIGSSHAYPLAVLIAERAASKVGNGYLALSVPDEVYPIAASRCSLTTIFEPIENHHESFIPSEGIFERLDRYDAILFGNGIASTKENYEFLCELIRNYRKRLVLDATALSLLAAFGCEILLKKAETSEILLTPHLGEARRLFKSNIQSRNPKEYLSPALAFCQKYHIHMLLKSYQSYYVDEKEATLSPVLSSPSLAKAGSGDGLAGYLAGVLAFPLKKELKERVLFADRMIHLAAKTSEQEKTVGGANIISAIEKIPVMEK